MINRLFKIWKAKLNVLFILVFLYISCSPNKPNSNILEFYNYPNPFSPKNGDYTTYKVIMNGNKIMEAKLEIYSKSGDLIVSKNLIVDEINKTQATNIWSGLDKNGKYLPSSVYNAKIIVKDEKDANYIAEFKTSIK